MSKAHDYPLIKVVRSLFPSRRAAFYVGILFVGAGFFSPFILLDNKGLAEQQAGPNSGDGAKGKIEFSEMRYDFGFIAPNGVFAHTFIAKNVGKGVLNIIKIDPTCGCTTVPITKAFLKPGEEVRIRVNFNSKNITGKVAKRIKVLSTDPEDAASDLYITGIVGQEPRMVTIDGPQVRFNQIDIQNRQIQITSRSAKKDMTLTILPMSDDFLRATLSSQTLGPGNTSTLTLSLVQKPPLGEYASSVTVECAADSTERFSIPITGIGYAR